MSPVTRRRARRRTAAHHRLLVAGWFSFERMGATAGDLLARDVVCGWLTRAGIEFDVAQGPRFPGGVDWQRVDPRRYQVVVFVCGPFYVRRRLVRWMPARLADGLGRLGPVLAPLGLDPRRHLPLELLVARFSNAQLVGLDVSVLGPAGAWQPFAFLLERDGAATTRPDLVFLAGAAPVPVVGLVLAEDQREYPSRSHQRCETLLREVLNDLEAVVVPIDTRLDPANRGGLRTPAEVESLIARMDAVVTTRLHGAVLALKNGVPALVVDPVPGGAKVRRQAEAVGWPTVFDGESVQPGELRQAMAHVLSPQARELAHQCSRQAADQLDSLREEFLAGLASITGPERRPSGRRTPASARSRGAARRSGR